MGMKHEREGDRKMWEERVGQNILLCLQDFHLSRVLGFSVYLPICPFTTLPALWTAVFGLLPCVLAILTVIVYIIW